MYNFEFVMENVVNIAKLSTCNRSKCGSIIIKNNDEIIGKGYNSMPCNVIGECFKDKLSSTFKSDKTCCIHAEQRAILDALRNNHNLNNTSIFFIRLNDDDKPKISGEPYCSICSKMALDVGISNFYLYRENGWESWNTKIYNDLTFKYK